MPTMRITLIVKDTISPTTHAEILASFCSSLHRKLCFVSIEEKLKKNRFITDCFNNLKMNNILKNMSCCKF